MTPQGIRKAAMLLMNLPSTAAAELLRSARPDTVTRILAELAYLQSENTSPDAGFEPVREFVTLVSKSKPKEDKGQYVQQLLESSMGSAKAPELMKQVQDLLARRDPFATVRTLSPKLLAKVLEGEAPQVVTMIMVELPLDKSTELLNLLKEETRIAAVQSMAAGMEASADVKIKVASMIEERLRPKDGGGGPAAVVEDAPVDDIRQKQLRKVALLLRGLEKPMRDLLAKSIAAQDAETAKTVAKLMVIWEDIPLLGDRVLQEILRKVDSRKLALSLVKADPALTAKFRGNMSERAAVMLDEESSLLSNPKQADVLAARENILDQLRAVNEKGELTFGEAKT